MIFDRNELALLCFLSFVFLYPVKLYNKLLCGFSLIWSTFFLVQILLGPRGAIFCLFPHGCLLLWSLICLLHQLSSKEGAFWSCLILLVPSSPREHWIQKRFYEVCLSYHGEVQSPCGNDIFHFYCDSALQIQISIGPLIFNITFSSGIFRKIGGCMSLINIWYFSTTLVGALLVHLLVEYIEVLVLLGICIYYYYLAIELTIEIIIWKRFSKLIEDSSLALLCCMLQNTNYSCNVLFLMVCVLSV